MANLSEDLTDRSYIADPLLPDSFEIAIDLELDDQTKVQIQAYRYDDSIFKLHDSMTLRFLSTEDLNFGIKDGKDRVIKYWGTLWSVLNYGKTNRDGFGFIYDVFCVPYGLFKLVESTSDSVSGLFSLLPHLKQSTPFEEYKYIFGFKGLNILAYSNYIMKSAYSFYNGDFSVCPYIHYDYVYKTCKTFKQMCNDNVQDLTRGPKGEIPVSQVFPLGPHYRYNSDVNTDYYKNPQLNQNLTWASVLNNCITNKLAVSLPGRGAVGFPYNLQSVLPDDKDVSDAKSWVLASQSSSGSYGILTTQALFVEFDIRRMDVHPNQWKLN